MDTFASFGWMHFTITAVSAVGWWLMVLLARKAVGEGWESQFRLGFGLTILVVCLAFSVTFMIVINQDLIYSLPMNACDLAWMIAVWSLLAGGDSQKLRHQLMYYWGFGFCSFSYLTPSLQTGPGDYFFWHFWLWHWLILATAIVNVTAFGVRPTWRGFRNVIVATIVIVTPITLFNVYFDTSYFFTGEHKPSNPTPLDLMGEWPWRILWMCVVAIVIFAGLTLPACFKRSAKKRPASDSSSSASLSM